MPTLDDAVIDELRAVVGAEHVLAALDKLGYGDFRKDAEEVCVVMEELVSMLSPLTSQVLTEVKESAAKRRRQSTRLENLGIPEEELLRQQQELFAKARESALLQERAQLEQLDNTGREDSGGGGGGGEQDQEDTASEEESES